MKNKFKLLAVSILVVVCAIAGFGLVNGVYAQGSGSGTTGGDSATSSACVKGSRVTRHVCKDYVEKNGKDVATHKTGGASWFLFKTSSDILGKGKNRYNLYANGVRWCLDTDDYNKDRNNSAYPKTGCDTPDPMKDGGYDYAMSTNCPVSEYDYYLANTFNGWNGRDRDGDRLEYKNHVLTYWGPIAVGAKVDGNGIDRNATDVVKDSDVNDHVHNGESNIIKVSDAYAKKACKNAKKGVCENVNTATYDSHNSVAYICLKWENTLTGRAVNTNGTSIKDEIDDVTDTVLSGKVNSGPSAAVTARPDTAKYEFKGWASDIDDAKEGKYITRNKTTANKEGVNTYVSGDRKETFHVKSLVRDVKRYAVYDVKSYTLTLKPIDEEGNSLNNVGRFVNKTDTAKYGHLAHLDRIANHNGYEFKKFAVGANATAAAKAKAIVTTDDDKSMYVLGSANPKERINVNPLTDNITVYAVYKKTEPTVPVTHTLTLKHIDVNGSSISGFSDKTDTAEHGKPANVTRENNTSKYTFVKFAEGNNAAAAAKATAITTTSTSQPMYVSNSNTQFNVKSLTGNKTVYAVYRINTRILTAKFVDVNGRSLSSISGFGDISSTVNYGQPASVERPRPTDAYDFRGWKVTTLSNCSDVKKFSYVTTTNTNQAVYVSNSNTRFNVKSLTTNSHVCGVYEKKSYTLTARSIDEDGNSLATLSGLGDKVAAAEHGDPASVTRGENVLYEFKGWKVATSPSLAKQMAFVTTTNNRESVYVSGNANPKETFNVKALTGNLTVYAIYKKKPSLFEGKSSVTGATNQSSDWASGTTSKTTNAYIENCSPTDGCNVSFEHKMKRTQGIEGTNYVVSRESNLITSTRAIQANNNVASGDFQPGKDLKKNNIENSVSETGPFTLYPGMVLCEKLTFAPNDQSTNTIYSRICASALGDSQPPDSPDPDTPETPDPNDPNKLTGDKSFINIKVRNQNVAAFNNYQREVYAKPGDSLDYRSTYNPVLQYTYYLKPQQMQIDNGTIYPSSGINKNDAMSVMFNQHKTPYWNNANTVFSSGFITPFNQNYKYTPGNMNQQQEKNSHTVLPNEVGRSLDETIKTNRNNDTKTTPKQVVFRQRSDVNLGNVLTASLEKTAYAKVPYNFINTTEIKTGGDNTVYSGETETFSFDIITSKKRNNVTDGTYATIVRDAKWKLEFCYDNNATCLETTPTSTANSLGNVTIGTVNASYNTEGSRTTKDIKVSIPDLRAGSDICVRSAIYPASSGDDRNYTDKEGNHAWAYSNRVCYKVAKKPSLEVWGGNIYTKGGIETSLAVKGNLAGYNNYGLETAYMDKYVFGSWGELGVISGGTINQFGSAASMGFARNSGGTLMPNPFGGVNNNNPRAAEPGGSRAVSLCNRSQLTFANDPCSTTVVGSLGNSIGANSAEKDKAAIISKYIYDDGVNVDGNVALNDANKIKDANVYYYRGNNVNVPGSTVAKNTIQVVHANNVTVGGDLVYESGYENYDQMPKLVIYAENNININCGVNRIDALLIANKEVKTCANSTDINSPDNSRQLVVNGAIVTGKLTPNRTYGAATGANSIIPAEIINFDPTLYRWGNGADKTVTGGTNEADLNVVYTQEIAPRL